MTTYIERLRPVVKLTSPNGTVFEGKWLGSPRSAEKRLGLFNYPGIIGTVVQDLGMTSWMWPMTVYFDGPDNDKVANKFGIAVLETGIWGVIHPVYGFRGLQLISVTERNMPVDEGGYTAFELDFIEPIDPLTLKTAAEMSDQIGFQSDLVSISAADQFLANARLASASDQFSLESAINAVTGPINSILGPIAEASDRVFETQNAIQRGIQEVLTAGILQPLSLAGQIQQLVQNPLRAITDIKARLSAYADLASSLFGMTPEQPDNKGRNFAAVQELTLTSVMTSNALIANTKPETVGVPSVGGLRSRKDVHETADDIANSHVVMTDEMEEVQAVFEDEPIENQYISQSLTHFDTAQLTGSALAYLFVSSFDLNVERRLVLDRPRHTVKLAIDLYNGPGEQDSNIDLFLESNDLHGDDIIRLPAGREVVFYA
jgi:hypothetical protein